MLQYYIAKLIKKLHIPAIKKSKIDKTSKVCSSSHLVNVFIAKYSYIGNFCTVLNTNIGAFCSIADNVVIGGASHPLDWVSTSPLFHSGANVLKKNFFNHDFTIGRITNIGNDVWIGEGAMIKAGVTIADGAVVGMGSIVTKNVEPYCIVAGNPARVIKKRFDDDTIKVLLKLKWWEWEEARIRKNAELFNDITKFKNLAVK